MAKSIVERMIAKAEKAKANKGAVKREAELLDQIDKVEGELAKLNKLIAKNGEQVATDDPKFYNPDHLRNELAREFVEGETFAVDFDVKAVCRAMLILNFAPQRRTALNWKRRELEAKAAPMREKLSQLHEQLNAVQSELAG